MRSFWSDPYLWVHLAGAAAVPLFLELCLLGLGVGSPLRPMGLEFALVGIAGIAPVLWMQWQKPFSIFSLVILALKPDQLTIDQRRILKLFKAPLERVLAVLTAIALLALLWQLYKIAPIASEVTPFGRFGRLGGVLVAAIAFLGCNLFLQIPVSVLRVLLTSEKQFAATEPYAIEKIAQDFTLLGLPVQKILPTIKAEAKAEIRVEAETSAEVKPEIAVAEPLEAVAIAPAVTVAPIEPIADVFEEPEEPEAIRPIAEPVAEVTTDAVDLAGEMDEIAEAEFTDKKSEPEDAFEQNQPAQDPRDAQDPLDTVAEPILEAAAEPVSETIHIIELELIEDLDSEEPYPEVIVVGEEIIDVEVQAVSEEKAIDSSAIEESNWEDDDWEEE